MSSITVMEISNKERWGPFFTTVSEQYAGWMVSIEVLERELGDQHAAEGPPLQGITYETSGSQAGDILIETGDAGTSFETHAIHRPNIVRFAVTRPGDEVDIEIEDQGGITTLVHIRRAPQLPPG